MKKSDINVLIGSGGHASSVASIFEKLGRNIDLICSNEKSSDIQKIFFNAKHINEESLNNMDVNKVMLINGIGFMPNNYTRMDIFNLYIKKSFNFITLIAPTASIAKTSEIDRGASIHNNVFINTFSKIGENTIVNSGSIIEHHVDISRHCHIAPGSVICGNVKVKEGTFIGARSIIAESVSIGKNCIIGAGSVLLKDIPDNTKFINGKVYKI